MQKRWQTAYTIETKDGPEPTKYNHTYNLQTILYLSPSRDVFGTVSLGKIVSQQNSPYIRAAVFGMLTTCQREIDHLVLAIGNKGCLYFPRDNTLRCTHRIWSKCISFDVIVVNRCHG